jgi:hypothetical protein
VRLTSSSSSGPSPSAAAGRYNTVGADLDRVGQLVVVRQDEHDVSATTDYGRAVFDIASARPQDCHPVTGLEPGHGYRTPNKLFRPQAGLRGKPPDCAGLRKQSQGSWPQPE